MKTNRLAAAPCGAVRVASASAIGVRIAASRTIGVYIATALLAAAALGWPAGAGADEVKKSGMQSFEGSWDGYISYMGQKIAIALRLIEDAQGWRGQMDIPPQKAFNLPLTDIRETDGMLRATLLGATPLVLQFSLKDSTLTGRFTQGPAAGDFSAVRIGDAETLRAQLKAEAAAEAAAADPSIESANVSVDVPGGKLFGTLSRPAGAMADTAILIIPGSGPTDRDGNSILLPGKNDSLLQLGNALVKKGHMVLRADKRGIGKSVWTGLREEDMTIDMMADDAAAWLSFLRGQSGIKKAAVIGHSEGALVALLATRTAAAQALPSALVLLTPLSADFFETLFKQLAGTPEEYQKRARHIYEELRAGRYTAEVKNDQMALFRPSVQPYLRSLIVHQPGALLAALRIPALVVAGGRDLQIELADAKALAAVRPDVRFLFLKDMNHVLKTVGPDLSDNQASYSQPTYPLAEGLVGGIAGFLSGD